MAVSRPVTESIVYTPFDAGASNHTTGLGALLFRTTTGTSRLSPGITYTVSSSNVRSSVLETTTDRKSTRLNSSHSQISYAVFCLKKKKKKKSKNNAEDRMVVNSYCIS